MVRRLIALLSATFLTTSSWAQEVPNHAVPIGRGPGVVGWGSLGPCAAGQTFGWTAPSTDPICIVSGGGGGSASITRAQIPTQHTAGATNLILSGYTSANDKGVNAPYTCSGQSSTSLNAIQDADGVWCAMNFSALQTTGVYPGWFGAKADDGVTTISSGDISAHPEWRGTYAAGTTWDTVGVQEAIYAAFAFTSTPGVINWNSISGARRSNLQLNIPNGFYGINVRLTANMQAGKVVFQSKGYALLEWINATPDYLWYCDGCSYSSFYNMSLQVTPISMIDYGTGRAALALDWSGNIGSLKTQQNSFYDLFINIGGSSTSTTSGGNGVNGRGVDISPSGSGAQGDTNQFFNPVILCDRSEFGFRVSGSNALDNTIFGGDMQGCTRAGYLISSGSMSFYGSHTENQFLNGFANTAPITDQFTTYGASVAMIGQVNGSGPSVINGWRSEDSVGAISYGYVNLNDGLDIQGMHILNCCDVEAWSAATAFFQEGSVVQGGTDNRVFMLVDSGGTDWRTIGSVNDGTHTITDSGSPGWTVNQWVGYSAWVRFSSNGFAQRCTIASNTASAITLTTGCAPTLSSQTDYQIVGTTAGSAPAWNTAANSIQESFPGTFQGAWITAGSTCAYFSGSVGGVGDYVAIPNGRLVGPAGHRIPTIFVAKITSTASCGAIPGGGPTGNITLNRTPNNTIQNGPGYRGTPIADGTQGMQWIDFPFIAVGPANAMSNIYVSSGGIATGGSFSAVKASSVVTKPGHQNQGGFNSVILGSPSAVPATANVFVSANYTAHSNIACAPPTWTASFDMAQVMGNCNAVQLVPTQNMTLTNSSVVAGSNAPFASQEFTLNILTNGTTPFTITFGSGFSSNGPINTGTVSLARIAILFRYDLVGSGASGGSWVEVSRNTYGPNSQPLLYSAAATALPACTAANKGATATVSDATAPTYNATYTSGGAVPAIVLCDGTNWKTR